MIRLVPALAAVVVLCSAGGTGRLTVNGLPVSGRTFAIGYVHSIYRAPSAEVFTVEGRRFTMRAVVSGSGGVLDYYALDGERARTPDGAWVLRLAEPATYEELSLLTTSIGRRTVISGGRCLPLDRTGEVRLALELTVDVRGEPCRPPFGGPRSAVHHSQGIPSFGGPRSAVHHS
ncbi:hypothetical protein C1J01_36065 [Nonomuraea aridisoli]|uniref:DUF1850 domain-containing protein n=1 Tax=Nonomuraea aridisoli TaxID=2070368 RepID=A0A2W2EAJ3_9ACTN|nr:hypothetical protein C1J01_36065 [Nonomuraea aridisoli]